MPFQTVTVINLAAALTLLNKRVLVVDMDPQANSCSGVGLDKQQAEKTIFVRLVTG